jgi:hypothetical protein
MARQQPYLNKKDILRVAGSSTSLMGLFLSLCHRGYSNRGYYNYKKLYAYTP